jgi:hypothetical protein
MTTFARLRRGATPIFAIFLLAAFGHLARADNENCDLKAPLENAMVARYEGAYFFVYPPVPLPHYNGCQIMWIEKQKAMIGRFKDGSLVEVDDLNEDGSVERKCFYTNYQLTADSDEKCGAPENFGHSGLQYAIGGNQGVRVPPDRDIRIRPKPCSGSEKSCAK